MLSAFAITAPTDPAERALFEQNYVPLEALNRDIFDINQFVDRILTRPVAKVYLTLLPEDGRDMIRRLLDNMKEPGLYFKNLLHDETSRTGISARPIRSLER